LAASEGEGSKPEEKPEPASPSSRRAFVTNMVTFSLLLVAGGVASVTKALISPPASDTSNSSGGGVTTLASFPKVQVANVADIQLNQPVFFNYPFEEQPNILVKLGVKAENGIGPDGDIVAFSQICQHLGCIYSFQAAGSSPSCDATYQAPGPVGYCCCHGSVFDLTEGAAVIGGPSPRPEPQVILELDGSTGNIYAVGMAPPTVFGFDTGSSDISNDLVGGTPVT
jgi:arsenite oxidase small subunit